MSVSSIIKPLIFINILIFVTYGENSINRQPCKPDWTTWEEGGTQYRSLMYRNESHAYVICKAGFTASSSSKVRCVAGVYEHPLPRCERVTSSQCEPIPSLEIIIRKCDSEAPSVGTKCQFRCPEGYTIKGSVERFCGTNLQWSGKEPRCLLNQNSKKFRHKPTTVFDYVRYNNNQKQDSRHKSHPCEVNNGGCEQLCDSSTRFAVCSCRIGYKSVEGGKCKDVNECDLNNGGCSDTCTNIHGSYRCTCPTGFRLKNVGKMCIDIDECQYSHLNKCNQKCINALGSYVCSCDPGYILKNNYECEGCRKNSYRSEIDYSCIECPPNSVTDSEAKSSIADCHCRLGYMGNPSRNEACDDINECFLNNFGCSHSCMNTPGSAFCSCPVGFELKHDNKTCVDTDECQIKNGGCEKFCHNFLGSFSCSCPNGYALAEDTYSCIDEDECPKNNGNCSDICNSFPGGHYCSCFKGFRLGVDGKTCAAARCLSVAVPHHSSMRCRDLNKIRVISKPHDVSSPSKPDYSLGTICRVKCSKGFKVTTQHETIECMEDGRWNATTPQCEASHCPSIKIPENANVYPSICREEFIPVQQQCYFACNPGHEMFVDKTMIKCKNNLTWTNDPPSCKPVYTVPSITCPDDITVDLAWNENYSNVSILQPITNMEIVEVYPDWIKLEESIPFPSGKTDVLFIVKNFNSNITSQCIMTINIVDKQPPMFTMCPKSFNVGDVGYGGVIVTWDEPISVDNVGIQSVVKNLEPNSTLTVGIHFIEYTAKDAAGNSATCAFQVNITRGHCNDLSNPGNGNANCMNWLMGRLCRPDCNPGYLRDPDEPKFFACGDSGIWTPTNVISPCLAQCLNGMIWSSISERCDEELSVY